MLRNTLNIFLVILISTLLACSESPIEQTNEEKVEEQTDEGKIEGQTYTSQDIGWTIEIPEGWTIVNRDIIAEQEAAGKRAVEEVAGEIDVSGLKYLISFKKDQTNLFQSTSEFFEEEYHGEWQINNQLIKEVLYNTYTNQGINIDTSSSKASIDGVDFNVFKTILYGPEGEVLLNQELYSSYINGYDFGVALNYTSDENRAIMMRAWENSTFRN